MELASELTGPPTLGIAVGDPQGLKLGTTPAQYIFFGAYEDPMQSAPPARAVMEEWAMLAEAESPFPLETIAPLSVFQVNGVDAASKTYSTAIQGRSLVMRVCFLSAGNCVYIFSFRTEAERWDTEQALIETVLNSFTVENSD